jgi:alkanesulfonate monooxygenase SsuD/methylene tetrahydromethanopterin reductase-like flavin-dependent oxidoreductase (luciferase family)
LEDDLPDKPPLIAVAASGPVSARIAVELGDGPFATEPDGDLVSSWQNLGGSGPASAEMPLAWAADEDKAAQAVLEKSRFRPDRLEGHGPVAQPGSTSRLRLRASPLTRSSPSSPASASITRCVATWRHHARGRN